MYLLSQSQAGPARRRALLVLVALLAAGLAVAPPPAEAAGAVTFSDVVATPYMDGSRLVITWTTDQPATTKLYWAIGNQNVAAPAVSTNVEPQYVANQVGTRHVATLYNLPAGVTVWYKAAGAPVDEPTLESQDALRSVVAANGPSRWDASCPDSAGGCYTFNVYVRFDRDVRATEWPVWQTRFEFMALRVNDMTDGWGRLGRVVLLDSLGVSEEGHTLCSSCMSDADVIIHDKIPFDSHTFLGGIESGGSIALGYHGQLVTLWENAHHFGRVAAHEFGHYAFWLDDQYDIATGADSCVNTAYDISIMNNNNRQTEIDSADTPCAWQNGGARNSWDDWMRPHYPNIPTRVGAPDPGPTGFGGALEFVVVDRGL